MKLTKLLFSISLLSLLAFQASSQTIETGTRFFCVSYSFWGGMGAFVDSLYVTKTSADTIEFVVANIGNGHKSFFIKTGNTVVLRSNNDTTLMYDYNLETGDTFVFKKWSRQYFFRLDSIKIRMLEDGKPYKHWYLHEGENLNSDQRMIWIENLGSLPYGWDYTHYGSVDY